MRILLLEPDRVLANIYRTALQRAGHKVMMTATAQAAIITADDFQPELVVMELQLTSHSGIEFLYEFRSYDDWARIPVLVISQVSAGEFADAWELLHTQLGVAQYHYKPLTSLRKLVQSVEKLSGVVA